MQHYTPSPMTNIKTEKQVEESPVIDTTKAVNISEESNAEVTSTNQEVNEAVNQVIEGSEQAESLDDKLKKYQILHIDDEAQILRLVPRMFRNRILKSSSFGEAKELELVKALEESDIPTIIISDNSFGGKVNGLELAIQTYQLRQDKKVPFIIFCDPPTDQEWQAKLENLLATRVIDGFLTKPSAVNDVVETIKNSIK